VFWDLANHTKAQAQDPINAYDPVNVKDTWFSVANYFRRADFYLHGNWSDPLIDLFWQEQTVAFDNGMAGLPVPGKRIRIPAGNFTVETIWFSASLEHSPRPTLILGTGYDNSQEDLFHTFVVPALARGWNCLTYEGPGQPSVRRGQEIGFIPDWERVVTPVVDYLLTDLAEEVDASQLALLGYSFGGYLAARAAAFEPRITALLLDGGIYDFHTALVGQLPSEFLEIYDTGNKSAFDKAVRTALDNPATSTNFRWGMEQGLWSFNIESPFDFLEATTPYTVKDILGKISVPVWIANGEYDNQAPGQSKQVYDALGETATLHNFTGVAGNHCQIGANQELGRVIFAWLHQTFL
jgi:pimeloyl-ACP methyl ester carboxylesterase